MLIDELIIQEMTVMSNVLANMVRDLTKKNRELEVHILKLGCLVVLSQYPCMKCMVT